MARAALKVNKRRQQTELFSLSDRELVSLARKRDEMAFSEITGRYRKRLLCTIYRLTGDWNISEDLVQEVLIRAFRNLKSFNPRYAFSTWVYTIARHTAYDYLKKSRVKMVSLDTDPRDDDDGRGHFELGDNSKGPDEIVEDKEMSGKVEEALLDLPSPYREAMYMRHLEWKTYTEISDHLGIPIGTVKSYLFRGRRELQKKLSTLLSPLGTNHTSQAERVAMAS
jgi:RNA polymerase sigma-70 factor (ECF subfamily)